MDIIRVQQHTDAWVKLQDEKKNELLYYFNHYKTVLND